MTAYYNEFDPKAAAWLRELISKGLIAPGEVDERSIEDVRPTELMGYTQCHFFAGIGGWSYALRLAGWPDDRPVWTGSCPCQPYSSAGARGGADDPRNLWWAFRWHIDQCRPATVFGEQVASADGREWLAGVSADLEQLGYQVGAADLCAAGVGAPHIRQRLFWYGGMAHATRERGWGYRPSEKNGRGKESRRPGIHGGVADSRHAPGRENSSGRHGPWRHGLQPKRREAPGEFGDGCGLGDTSSTGTGRNTAAVLGSQAQSRSEWLDPWSVADCLVIAGADGKARRIKSGIEPLVDGIPGRVVPGGAPSKQESENTGEARIMRLRGYGNAIVPAVAAEFIKATT